jgi:hypothetical protein
MNSKKLHTGIFLGALFFAVAIFIAPHLSHAATFECDFNSVNIGGDTGWYNCPGMDFSDQSQIYTFSGFPAGGTMVQVCSGNDTRFHGCGIFYTDSNGNLTFGDVYAASGDSWLHFASGSDSSMRSDTPIYGTTAIAPSYSLNPVTPTSNGSLADFSQWTFSYGGQNLITTSDNYYIDVQYNNSDYSVYGDDQSAQFSGSTFTSGGANLSFNKATSLPAGNYSAYVSLVDASNYNYIVNKSFNFTVVPGPAVFTWNASTGRYEGSFNPASVTPGTPGLFYIYTSGGTDLSVDDNDFAVSCPGQYGISNPGQFDSTGSLIKDSNNYLYATWNWWGCGSIATIAFGNQITAPYDYAISPYPNYVGDKIYLSDSPVSPVAPTVPPASVSLLFPTNGTTSPDFSNWVVGWSGDVPYGEMHVVYGMSSSSLNYDDHIDFSPFVSANPLPIYKSQPLFFIPLAIPATWYAQVMDMGATETVFSNIVSFQINPNFANPTSNSTDTTLAGPFLGVGGGETSSTIPNPTTNCQYTSSSFLSDPIGNIQNGICNAFVFLFIPNGAEQTALNTQFTNTWTQISNRVPFGYAGIIMAAFQGFKEGATTSTLITSSTYRALSSVLDPLKTGISFMLILLLAFAILHFVRNITL